MSPAPTSSGPKVAVATYAELPNLSEDEQLLVAALGRLGVSSIPVVWGDAHFDARSVNMLLVRSTWDYFRDPNTFLGWIDQCSASTRVWNSPRVIHWNAHKRYLSELERVGIPVVPTIWLDGSESPELRSILATRGWSRIVIKPAIGADGWLAASFGPRQMDEAQAHLRTVLDRGDAMVQPLLESAVRNGELSLVFLDGEFSHAVHYPSKFGLNPVRNRTEKTDPDLAAIRIARKCLTAAPESTLYARVDLLPGEKSDWMVGELELIEPELAFRSEPPAARRLAEAIARRLDLTAPRDG